MQGNTHIDIDVMPFINGEWHMDADRQILKKYLGNSSHFGAQHLVDNEGYLLSKFKDAIVARLGDDVLEGVEGPFSDEDIFCGDVDCDADGAETVHYYLELRNIDTGNLKALEKIADVHFLQTNLA